MLHIPILRRGKPYRSVEVTRTANMRTGEPFVEISLANVGLIRRDLLRQEESRAALAALLAAFMVEAPDQGPGRATDRPPCPFRGSVGTPPSDRRR